MDRRLRRASWLLAFFVGGCSSWIVGRGAEPTPAQVFEQVRQAVRIGDWEAVYDRAAAPSTRQFFESDFQKMKEELQAKGGAAMFANSVIGVSEDEYAAMTARDYFVHTSRRSGRAAGWGAMPTPESMASATILESRIDGESGWLTVELADHRRPVGLRRENGRWYFQLLDDD